MTDKPRIAILGAGCHGKVVLDALLAGGCYEVAGIIDDNPAKHRTSMLGYPVVGASCDLSRLAIRMEFEAVALAIGDNYHRHEKYLQVRASGIKLVSVIHPSACISRFAEIGEGAVILAGAIVNPGAVLEENVCVNTRASIDHDNHLMAHCHVHPGATLAGTVTIGEFSYVGSGATILPNVNVGAYSLIGAGTTVISDVSQGVVVAGAPAQVIGIQEKRPRPLVRAAAAS